MKWDWEMRNYLKNTNKKSASLEKGIKQLTGTIFFAAKPRVTFTSSPFLTPKGKYRISKSNKNMVIYQFECYCDNSFIGITSRQLK